MYTQGALLYVVQCRLAGKDLFHLLLAVLMLDDFQNKPGRGAELLKICDIGEPWDFTYNYICSLIQYFVMNIIVIYLLRIERLLLQYGIDLVYIIIGSTHSGSIINTLNQCHVFLEHIRSFLGWNIFKNLFDG